MTVSAERLHELVDAVPNEAREALAQVIAGFIPSGYTITDEQKETLRSRRNDPDPSHWRTRDEDDQHIRELIAKHDV